MNDTFMVHTGISNGNGLSTDDIQLQLKPILEKPDEKHSSNQPTPLDLVIRPKIQDDIVVKFIEFKN